jgi:hypothetical protein
VSPEEEIPLSQHDLLDPVECAAVRDRVIALQSRWISRSKGFFTLGAASYLEAPEERGAYLEAARAQNPLLDASFAALLERVRRFFEDLLGETAYFDRRFALPGFHVIVHKGIDMTKDKPARRAHFDMQWMDVTEGSEPLGTLSFTLPIASPTGGSSLALWHLRYWDAFSLNVRDYAEAHPPQTLTYTHGRMVIHDGLLLHAIGGSQAAVPEGLRITLQGHGLRSPKGWMLYW